MKRHIRYGALTLAASLLCPALPGCIRDDLSACPPLSIKFDVQDRQYVKGSAHVEEGDEDEIPGLTYDDPYTPSTTFAQLIPTVYCALSDDSGRIVREMHLHSTDVNDILHSINFDDELPFGHYTVTAWGAIADEDALGADPSTLDMTGIDSEVFTATADIDYDYDNAEVTANFLRATGMVIVETRLATFPKEIDACEMTFTGLSSEVDRDLKYKNTQTITTKHTLTRGESVKNYIVLPPTDADADPTIHVRYYDSLDPMAKGVVPATRPLVVERNKITHYLYKFDPYSQRIQVFVMVDGRWQEVTSMGVD